MIDKFKKLPKKAKLPIQVTPILILLYAFGVIDEATLTKLLLIAN